MRLLLSLFLATACFCRLHGFSIWANGNSLEPLAGNINTIYVMNDCFINEINEDVIKYCATEFSPSKYITGAPQVVPNVVVVSSVPYPQPNNTVVIKKDNNLPSDWAMSCGQDASTSRFEIKFSTTADQSNFTKAKLLHEFGHGVGLGHTASASNVMRDNNSQISFLKEDEKQGLYSQYAPPEFKKDGDQYVLKNRGKLELQFKPLRGVEKYEVEFSYDEGSVDNTELIDDGFELTSADKNNIELHWKQSSQTQCNLKVYLQGSEDNKGKASIQNYSKRDEPAVKKVLKYVDFSPVINNEKPTEGDKKVISINMNQAINFSAAAYYNENKLLLDQLSLSGAITKVKYTVTKSGTVWSKEVPAGTDAGFSESWDLKDNSGKDVEPGEYMLNTELWAKV